MTRQVLSKDQRFSILIWITLAAFYLTYKEIAAFYTPTSTIVFGYESASESTTDSSKSKRQNFYVEKQLSKVELNSADSLDLVKLKIPHYLISKILLYRTQLGGYANSFQLLEIYHFPENIFERIHPLLITNCEHLKPIGINSKTEEELALHPYLSYKEAKAIVLFRKNHGEIHNSQEFEKIIAIPQETKEKLKPYLAKDFQSYANTSDKSP